MKFGKKTLFSVLLGVDLLANVLEFMHVNFLYTTTLIAFFACIVLPGFLISLILHISKISFWENLLIIVGLSIAFLEFGGLLLNILLPLFGINDPLAFRNLVVGFDIYVFLLFLFAWLRTKSFIVQIHLPRRSIIEKVLYALPLFFPILAALGAIVLNNGGSGILTLILLGAIALYSLLLVLFRNKISVDLYPYALFFIGMASLFTTSLRSWYITGHDIETEFYIFKLTNTHHLWNMAFLQDAYNACLSITILPTILTNLLSVQDMYIYKVIFQILFATSSVLVFFILRNYTTPVFAFLSAFLFLSFPTFFNDMAMLNRQEIGFIFFGLVLYVMLNSNRSQQVFSESVVETGALAAVSGYLSKLERAIGDIPKGKLVTLAEVSGGRSAGEPETVALAAAMNNLSASTSVFSTDPRILVKAVPLESGVENGEPGPAAMEDLSMLETDVPSELGEEEVETVMLAAVRVDKEPELERVDLAATSGNLKEPEVEEVLAGATGDLGVSETDVPVEFKEPEVERVEPVALAGDPNKLEVEVVLARVTGDPNEPEVEEVLATVMGNLSVTEIAIANDLPLSLRRILFIIFALSVIVSHYSTNFVLLAMVAFTYILTFIISRSFVKSTLAFLVSKSHIRLKNTFPNVMFLSLPLLLILFGATYFWNTVYTHSSNHASSVAMEVISSLFVTSNAAQKSDDLSDSLFFAPKQDPAKELQNYINGIRQSEGSDTYSQSIVKKYPTYILPQEQLAPTPLGNLLSSFHVPVFNIQAGFRLFAADFFQFFVFIGLLALFFLKNKKPIDLQYLLLCFSAIFLLALITVLPAISVEYGVLRMFQQALFILSLPITIGLNSVFFFIKEQRRILFIGIIIFILFLDLTGFIPHLTGDYYPQMPVDNAGLYYDAYYVHKSDVVAIVWLSENNVNQELIVTDSAGVNKMMTYGGIEGVDENFPLSVTKDSYVFVDNSDNIIVSDTFGVIIYSSDKKFLNDNKDLVYSNGKINIYK